MGCLFPGEMREIGEEIEKYAMGLQEIRLRVNSPVFLLQDGMERKLMKRIISREDIGRLFAHLCNHSMYAYEDEIRQGFLTTPEGHRIGLSGTVVLDSNGQIRTLKYVQAMNIRIAHEVKGVADQVLPYLYETGHFQNTLLLSAPGGGKTTLLRDLIRVISDGNRFDRGRNVSVIDERLELSGAIRGISQNDLGMRTDLLAGCPKMAGMELLIRSMRPEVLAVDELGRLEELECLGKACACGIHVLATAHGASLEDFFYRFREYIGMEYLFQRVLVLENCNNHFGVKGCFRKNELGNDWVLM